MSQKLADKLANASIGGLRYNAPMVQVALLGFVVFCSVGMFSAVSALGAGGTQSLLTVDIANSILFAFFAVGGIVSGAAVNLLGCRLSLSLGCSTFALYLGSLWSYQLHKTEWFLYLAAAFLGMGAALLWAAQGALMMALPTEAQKGRAFTLSWVIFQCGTIMGSLIVLGLTVQSKAASINTGIYLAFIILMFVGVAVSWAILPTHRVVRKDGTVVSLPAQNTVGQEIRGLISQFKDWRVLALLPMSFASNFFGPYQAALNGTRFNGRTRALNALLFGLGSCSGALIIGFLVDKLPAKRRMRGFIGCGVVALLTIAIWGGGLAFQVKFTRKDPSPEWDWTDPIAKGPMALMFAYQFYDASFQGLAYYILGLFSNDPVKLARTVGVYKGVQSAGGAIAFGLDSVATPFRTELLVASLLCFCSLPLMALVIKAMPESAAAVEGTIMVDDIRPTDDETMAVPAGHTLGGHVLGDSNKTGSPDYKSTELEMEK